MRRIPIWIFLFYFIIGGMAWGQSYRRGRGGRSQTSSSYVHPSILTSLSAGNSYYENWSSGGENALWWRFSVDGGLTALLGRVVLKNNISMDFGQTKFGEEDFRKSSDRLSAESITALMVTSSVNPYIALDMETQFAPGYDYSAENPVQVSDFIDPAYARESIGFIFWAGTFSLRSGFAVQQIITNEFTNFSDNPETEKIEKLRLEYGAEVVAEYSANVGNLLTANTEFMMFTPFDYVQVWWDSYVGVIFLRYFSANVGINFRYDPIMSERGQFTEALSVGLRYQYGG